MRLSDADIKRASDILDCAYVVADDERLKDLLAGLAGHHDKAVIVSWVNAHSLILARHNAAFAANLMAADFLMRDGIGVSLLLRALGREAGLNMNGTDLIPKILQAFKGRPVALLGTTEPYLSHAAYVMRNAGGKIVLGMDGFQEVEAYAKALASVDVDLVVLAMGMPKQEKVAAYLAAHLAKPLVILNGGAILDFMGGRFPRAPQLVQTMRLEWLYRLIQEPRRLWRRYLLGGMMFVAYTAQMVRATKKRRT